MHSTPEHPVDRLRIAYGVANDARLVERIGSKTQTVSSWRARGRVPEAVALRAAADCGVSADWILRGEGPGPDADSANADFPAATGPPRGPVLPAGGASTTAEVPPIYGQPEPAAVRLARIQAWWRHWWERASEEERVWAEVQLRRAYPEYAEWCRHWRPAAGDRDE